ncbi:hypothetical protein EON66_11075 [archaeon]|nr:MAG: hypothetical protein EON66_11075 [archaeon]
MSGVDILPQSGLVVASNANKTAHFIPWAGPASSHLRARGLASSPLLALLLSFFAWLLAFALLLLAALAVFVHLPPSYQTPVLNTAVKLGWVDAPVVDQLVNAPLLVTLSNVVQQVLGAFDSTTP